MGVYVSSVRKRCRQCKNVLEQHVERRPESLLFYAVIEEAINDLARKNHNSLDYRTALRFFNDGLLEPWADGAGLNAEFVCDVLRDADLI